MLLPSRSTLPTFMFGICLRQTAIFEAPCAALRCPHEVRNPQSQPVYPLPFLDGPPLWVNYRSFFFFFFNGPLCLGYAPKMQGITHVSDVFFFFFFAAGFSWASWHILFSFANEKKKEKNAARPNSVCRPLARLDAWMDQEWCCSSGGSVRHLACKSLTKLDLAWLKRATPSQFS